MIPNAVLTVVSIVNNEADLARPPVRLPDAGDLTRAGEVAHGRQTGRAWGGGREILDRLVGVSRSLGLLAS
jgi:hypothetical protein